MVSIFNHIDELMREVSNCTLPHKYFLTYDFNKGDRIEHENFFSKYAWNGIANRCRCKVRVYAVGLNPLGKRDHIHAVLTSSKPLEGLIQSGSKPIPLLMLIDALFEEFCGSGRWEGERLKAGVLANKGVIVSQNTGFFHRVAFGGYDRWRIQIQPYNANLGGIGYIYHHHDVILWTGNGVIDEFIHTPRKKKRYRRGKKRDKEHVR